MTAAQRKQRQDSRAREKCSEHRRELLQMRNEKMSYLIRIIAGGYLIYLAYKLFQGGILEGNMTGNNRILGIGACVLFVAAGAYFVVSSIRKLLLLNQTSQEEAEDQEAAAEEAEPEAIEETAGEAETENVEQADK